ncbi:hypothetical protein ACFXJO_11015 [Streptomyces lavendulae]|uniref:hypothetical protein n=1 Tax=Streptomyces TaxID=1883 RepID=UPI002476E286|nr:hypothetical protein [Streptomyces sp. SPB4]MDH6539537.1 hypothetical protein [Streptomyces sp. SPB4]
MKLKRMAIVAAAAVVGPTVLMATPAMADEVQNPAITTPDAAPAADAAAKPAAEAPATPAEAAKPAAETPAPAAETPAAKPAAETPATPAADAAKPAAETPAVPAADAAKPAADAKPAAQTPAPAAKAADAADAKDGAEWVANGPKLAVKDLPSSFKPGGGWQEFTLEVDNTGGKDLGDYSLGLNLLTRTTQFKDGYIALEVYLPDANGNWKWWPAEASGTEDAFGIDLGRGSIAKDDKFDIKLRLKFSKDAPATEFAVAPVGWSNVEGEEIFSDANFAHSEIKSGANQGGNTGGNTGGGHTGGGTKPNGGTSTTPIVDHNTGTGSTGTGTTGTTTNAGGQLAETGTDAATTWALGAGGVALAMGAALVAGNGRRRRVGA